MPEKNICRCPDPPGDYIECSIDQMALCIIENGIKRGVCQDVIKDGNDLAVINQVLRSITGVNRLANNYVSDSEITILRSGEYSEGDDLKVTFNLPAKVIASLDNIDRNRGLLLST